MTQGKIERWHRTLKDRILLNNYYLPEELERQIDAFVNHYNTNRYHECGSDDFSRYIIAWRLCKTMSASDVSATLRDALQATGLDRVGTRHRPRLLSDNGPCYVSSELQSWLAENSVPHTRGKPYHPMTQGKIERWHRTLKDRILLNNYYLPEELERQIDAFVNHYNTNRYHESLNNLTPYDVFTGQGSAILQKRDRIKEKTMILRKRLHFKRRAA